MFPIAIKVPTDLGLDADLRPTWQLPPDASMVTRFMLAARGGFLVSSEREAGEVKYVGLKSLLGNPATVVNPGVPSRPACAGRPTTASCWRHQPTAS